MSLLSMSRSDVTGRSAERVQTVILRGHSGRVSCQFGERERLEPRFHGRQSATFTLEEREAYGPLGLLPHALENLDRQLERREFSHLEWIG
jgi:hypothetical protein